MHFQEVDWIRSGRVDEVAVPTLEGNESNLAVLCEQFVEALDGDCTHLADFELAKIPKENRIRSRSRVRQALVNHVGVSINRRRHVDGNARSPERTAELVERLLQQTEGVVVKHVARTPAVAGVNAMFEVDEILAADAVRGGTNAVV